MQTPRLLVVGNICRDTIHGEFHLGGASAFGARAASHLGVHTALVTAAPARFKLLGRIRQDPLIRLLRGESPVPTAFRHAADADGVRLLYLQERARDLTLSDVPVSLRATPVAYVAPIMNECHRALLEGLHSPCLVVGAQGWMRTVQADGLVTPAATDELLEPPRTVRAMVFSELDHPDSEAIAKHLASRGVIVALTRGSRGLTLWSHGDCIDVPAAPAVEVESTGAGDVFAVVFGLTLSDGQTPLQAAQRACLAAARVVEGTEMGNLTPAFDGAVANAS
jgi:1D-myo-inositol 3-kinase